MLGEQQSGASTRYLVSVGTDALDEIGLGLTQSLHQLIEGGLGERRETERTLVSTQRGALCLRGSVVVSVFAGRSQNQT